jgi:LAO/AO transport system kinase
MTSSTSSTPSRQERLEALVAGVQRGDRRALARAITLVESTRDDDAADGQALLERLLPRTGRAVRVGISGTPGVGKSSFIEALGLSLVEQGRTLAVLAVDPSSPVSGGSILGDKTRMMELARHPSAFIRPSPSRGQLGGIARRTREALLLCEAAGFDTVLVETVGVGQSETAVASIVDTFLLLLHPGGGDELQGVKRGVLELTDVLVVHKADGDLELTAHATRDEYRNGARFFSRPLPGWTVPVLLASARTGAGLADAWQAVLTHRKALEDSGALAEKRASQAERWLWAVIEAELLRRFHVDDRVRAALPAIVDDVRSGRRAPTRGAWDLLASAGQSALTNG